MYDEAPTVYGGAQTVYGGAPTVYGRGKVGKRRTVFIVMAIAKHLSEIN